MIPTQHDTTLFNFESRTLKRCTSNYILFGFNEVPTQCPTLPIYLERLAGTIGELVYQTYAIPLHLAAILIGRACHASGFTSRDATNATSICWYV
jgi:hypothetical protein